jgi:hypothetical protein
VFWFCFLFIFYKHFCLLDVSFLKTWHLDTFPFLWLVSVQFEGLIVQTSRVERHLLGVLRACRVLSDVTSIEHPGDGLLPEPFLYTEAQQWGLDDTKPTIPQASTCLTFLFLSLHPNPSTSASLIL